jgi:predicted RNA-binding Zn ribbon-like protein
MDETRTFYFVSGHPALDLVGTVQKRRTKRLDQLSRPADLGRWFVEAGISSAPVEVGGDEFAAAVRLREAIYGIALAVIDDRALAAEDCAIVNEFAARPALRFSLGQDRQASSGGDTWMVLAELARGAVALFADASADRIRECAFDDCTRLYLDTSLGGTRRWCDMRLCGNRAKVAEFRARSNASRATGAVRSQG